MISEKDYLNQFEIEYRGRATNTSPLIFSKNLKLFFVKQDRTLALEFAPKALEVGIITQQRLKLKSLNLGFLLFEFYIIPGLLFSLLGINRFRIHSVGMGLLLLFSFVLSLFATIFFPCTATFIILGIVVLYSIIDLFLSRKACSKYNLKRLVQYTSLV